MRATLVELAGDRATVRLTPGRIARFRRRLHHGPLDFIALYLVVATRRAENRGPAQAHRVTRPRRHARRRPLRRRPAHEGRCEPEREHLASMWPSKRNDPWNSLSSN
jgi:hypothetical protein